MIRIALIVLVSVALLGAALPALEDARTTTTTERLETEAERIEREAAALATASVAVEDSTLAARTTVRVDAPSGLTAARIDRLALGDPAAIVDRERQRERATRSDDERLPAVALVYQLTAGPPRVIPIATGASTASIRVVDGPVELRTGGSSRLELTLLDEPDGTTVRISRVG